MRLTKATSLVDLEDAAALQAWQTAQQLEKGDLTEFQRAYFLKALGTSYASLSDELVKEHGLKGMMAEVSAQRAQAAQVPGPKRRPRKTAPPPTKSAPPRPKPKRTKRPPNG